VDIANQNELLITGHIIIMYFYEVFFLLILSKALSTMDVHVLKHIILRTIHACDLQILCEQSKFIEVVVLFLDMVKTVPSSSSLPPPLLVLP